MGRGIQYDLIAQSISENDRVFDIRNEDDVVEESFDEALVEVDILVEFVFCVQKQHPRDVVFLVHGLIVEDTVVLNGV